MVQEEMILGTDHQPHTGNTLIGPKLSIKNATGTVNTNGTIHIANGQYTGENNTNITIDKNMNIIGESQSGTIINGTGTNWIFHINLDVNVTIVNLTLTNATAINGAAITNYGTLTVSNCTFTNNKATSTTEYGGGAILNTGTINSITNCIFTQNTAPNSYGGAIENHKVNVNDISIIRSITNCIFTQNTANSGAGAIDNWKGAINSITVCTFTQNTANSGVGGAIINWNGIINSITVCTFTQNTASKGGAIASYDGASLTVQFSKFLNNTATAKGNAIYLDSGFVDANYNWWGSNNPTWSNLISGFTSDPNYWVILSVNATPATINNTQSATVTADLNHYTNSTGYVGELSTHIPDGQITLSIPWGSFTNSGITHTTTLNTVNDAVSAVFYANDGAVPASYNPVKVTASADDYTTKNTESAYITVNKITKLYLKTTSSSNNPKVGETFLLTYKLGNYGPDAADNVTITFQLPEGLDFVNIHVDNGKCTYNKTTRTVTWTLDSVPVGDPYLYLTVKAATAGNYKITANITSDTYNLNSGDYGFITFNVQPNNSNSGNGTGTNTVNAASKTTIGLQDTGLPLNYLLLAVLIVLSGLIPKRK